VDLRDGILRRLPRKDFVQYAAVMRRRSVQEYCIDSSRTTHPETVFDSLQYSRRTMSKPLISVLEVPFSDTLTAAYFFFCSNRTRENTASKSISSNLYRSLTLRLNSLAILSASGYVVTFEFTKTESVSP
jgi:hypothetical protein